MRRETYEERKKKAIVITIVNVIGDKIGGNMAEIFQSIHNLKKWGKTENSTEGE